MEMMKNKLSRINDMDIVMMDAAAANFALENPENPSLIMYPIFISLKSLIRLSSEQFSIVKKNLLSQMLCSHIRLFGQCHSG